MKMPHSTTIRNSCPSWLSYIILIFVISHQFLATESFSQQITFEKPDEPFQHLPLPEVEVSRQKRDVSLNFDNIYLGYGTSKESGPWNGWSALSECSRVCGGGVQYQTRVCLDALNPSVCVGPSRRYFSCNVQNCPVETDFRADQCSRFNSIPLNGSYHKWIPHTRGSNPCQLDCRPENARFYVTFAKKVIDGTRCFQNETTDICIEGQCVELGCDRILGSRLREDKCRVCGGDGSTCRTVEGIETQISGFQSGYNDLFLIPAGATNIHIREIKPTNNYIAIRSLSGKFYLNGDWHVYQSGAYSFANTKFYYNNRRKSGRNNIESLRSLGPTSEPLLIVLLHQEPNQGIAYEYSIPLSVYPSPLNATIESDKHGHGTKYAWIFGDFGLCSRDCGTGVQKRKVYCGLIDHDSGKQEQVKDDLCDSTNRPVDTRTCHNEKPCPATWFIGDWNNCSCIHQKQQRNVFCTTGLANTKKLFESDCPVLPDEKCDQAGPKPVTIQNCKVDNCPKWITGQWTECDSKCGKGSHNRTVRCGYPGKNSKTKSMSISESTTSGDSVASDDGKIMLQKREVETTTSAAIIMNQESVEETVSINSDNKIEDDIFVDDTMCDPETKPKPIDTCYKRPCDEDGSVEWVLSSWSNCEKDCGSKMSTRTVQCIDSKGMIWSDEICLLMHGGTKPADKQPCGDRYTCSRSFWLTSDWSECSDASPAGIRTRHVICAHYDESANNIIVDEDESKCGPADKKPMNSEVCKASNDYYTLQLGPFGSCTKPCGGGNRKRTKFCMKNSFKTKEYERVGDEFCKELEATAELTQQCNTDACDADKEAQLMGCEGTAFGCCPTDYSTPADEDYRNCPNVVREDISCIDSEFGCCPTNSSLFALGPFGLGCTMNCENSRFGCCPDSDIMSNLTDRSDCPKPYVEIPTTTLAPTTTEMPLSEEPAMIGAQVSKCEGSECTQVLIPTEKSLNLDCSSSKYGCCQDGWTSATGPDGEGCEDGSGDDGPGDNFFVTTISSIVNMFTTVAPVDESTKTIDQGGANTESSIITEPVVGDEQNCNQTQFGCCPNGKTKATGERYQGCTCYDYPYGCCQDRHTPAGGENYEGCVCSRMLYGCCPDGKTAVTGPNNEGCSCDSTVHGCCPDMVTAAQGANFFGCPCESLTYGCCPNSKIPAKGPDFKGCSCADTPFGCCPNGVTVAFGPNFKGCPSGPSLDMNLNSEVCNLQMQVGSCRNFTVKWYFDLNYGSCSRFWYGGCEGNGNRFQSQELCERACVKPEGTERCTLPVVRGPCNESIEAWYYNTKNRHCEPFNYGGCLGNTNRFESRQQCEEHCNRQAKVGDICDQPVSSGPCQGSHERWFYRREDGRCHRFMYGGCQGNDNNFQTQEECQNACAAQTPHEICSLPKAEGPCLGNFPRWHFDNGAGVCREFVYTGCEGNKNRFVDRESCERTCNQTIDSYHQNQVITDADKDRLPAIPSVPARVPESWENVCALPKAEGSCRASIIQWYYNSRNQRCERFYYGGCEGNANRFDDRETCESRCVQPISHATDPCLEPRETGNCTNFSKRWYFNVEDGSCHRFYYSGCNGNRNNFITPEECSSRCERPRETSVRPVTSPVQENQFLTEYCFKNFDYGDCDNANHIRLYYDHTDGVCKEFIYGGCGGNENRFESQIECQTRCWNSQNICKLKYARGSCSANFTQWFFDYSSGECFEFQYSGCQGNANRFSSKSACENQCRKERYPSSVHPPVSGEASEHSSKHDGSPTPTSTTSFYSLPAKCNLPASPGTCRGYFQRWFYSTRDHQCQPFIYGGCGGNENRFETAVECENTCRPIADSGDTLPFDGEDPQTICRLPAESGPCGQTQIKWYYEPLNHTCVPFQYGGCRGNKNRFQSFEHCIGLCGVIMKKELEQPNIPLPSIPEPVPLPPKPVEILPPPSQPPQQPSQPQPSIPALPPIDCEPMDCSEDRCSLGIDYYRDSRGCQACRCTNPCNDFPCPKDMSCALELYLNEQGKARGRTECRLNIKPGQCPSQEYLQRTSNTQDDTKCIQQCRKDADCRSEDKCCHNGCTYICVPPSNGTVPSEPSISSESSREYRPQPTHPEGDMNENEIDQPMAADVSVTFSAGQDAHLDCFVELSRAPISWTKNRQRILDSESSRYVILSNGSLRIKNVNWNDNGIYVCYQNQVPVGKNILLQIEAPARIHHDTPTKVFGNLGESAYLFCNSLGYPVPRVTWLRNETALQMDGNKYMQFGNNTLLIRNIEHEDSGLYSCQAFNGIGSPASLEVALLLSVASSTSEENIVPYNPTSNQQTPQNKPMGTLDQIGVEMKLIPEEYALGRDLQIKCIVRSQITGETISPTLLSSISWYFNSDIPLVNEPTQQKYRIEDNNSTLAVYNLAKTDSGKYRCRATKGPFADESASVTIQVEHTFVPPSCQDNPRFRNCEMIVRQKFCSNHYYATYCCRSCYLAGH